MRELYFLLFRQIANNPKQKYCMTLFHMLGIVAFLLSAVKHLQRKNKVGVLENIIAMFPQLLECYISFLQPYRHLTQHLSPTKEGRAS